MSWSRAAGAAGPPADPTIGPCCPNRRSTISSHQGWCRCTKHRRCAPGTDARACCCSDPRRRCFRRCNTRSKLWSRVRWLRRNMRGRPTSARLWCAASDSPDPRSRGSMLHRRRWVCGHPAATSRIWCSCLVAKNELELATKNMRISRSYQTIQLTDGWLVSWLRDVPDLDASLATRVHVLGWVWYCYGAHDFAVLQRVDLSGLSGDAGSVECIRWEGHGLEDAFAVHVKRISSEEERKSF